eukprot:TRINITY_DN7452_c0_g2_i7.p1 TRINITY_DN7452_c0_g2~~TRINITY_DN7452_c0_g2_i7.p1  ORF type:complete len:672 (+),score=110.56 TRINITY_DN7452_c0_g2_i7:176-2191(+)
MSRIKQLQEQKKKAEVCYNLGIQFYDKKNFEQALHYYGMAIEQNPKHVGALNNIGAIWKHKGDSTKAIQYYEKAIAADPTFTMAYKNIAIAYNDLASSVKMMSKIDQSIKLYEKALEYYVTLPDAYYNLGCVYMETGRSDEAIPYYEKAIQYYPKYLNAINNLATIYKEKGHFDKAVELYQQALNIDPAFPLANNNLAVVYSMQGRIIDAFKCLQRAIQSDPNYASAYNMMGTVCRDEGRSEKAIAYFEKAHILDPKLRGASHNKLLVMNDVPELDNETIYKAHVDWGREFSPGYGNLPITNVKDPNRRIKLGYVSSDFCTHSVSYFSEVLLSHNDEKQIQVYVYSTTGIRDHTTERLMSYKSIWKQLHDKEALEASRIINADGIDILVDLAGHSGSNRLDIFAHKPAPIQITWIGYPNTTGLPEMDYRITDANADPLDTQQKFSEKLLRLPGCFLCYTPAPNPPPTSPSPCIANGYITFGSFNNFAKINQGVLELWSQVLSSVPNSHLYLKCKPFSDEVIRNRAYDEIVAFGIDRSRISLVGHVQEVKNHLSLYANIDIALDTFPYAGTTTTVESVFMGVPVVTLKGHNHAHNVGVSLLRSVPTLTEFIAENEEEFVSKAVALATDQEKLCGIRRNLRQDFLTSRLCDRETYMKDVTSLMRDIWVDYCSS